MTWFPGTLTGILVKRDLSSTIFWLETMKAPSTQHSNAAGQLRLWSSLTVWTKTHSTQHWSSSSQKPPTTSSLTFWRISLPETMRSWSESMTWTIGRSVWRWFTPCRLLRRENTCWTCWPLESERRVWGRLVSLEAKCSQRTTLPSCATCFQKTSIRLPIYISTISKHSITGQSIGNKQFCNTRRDSSSYLTHWLLTFNLAKASRKL